MKKSDAKSSNRVLYQFAVLELPDWEGIERGEVPTVIYVY